MKFLNKENMRPLHNCCFSRCEEQSPAISGTRNDNIGVLQRSHLMIFTIQDLTPIFRRLYERSKGR